MSIDPNSRKVTSFFMILAVIVMLALAWSVASDDDEAPDVTAPQASQSAE